MGYFRVDIISNNWIEKINFIRKICENSIKKFFISTIMKLTSFICRAQIFNL